MEKLNGILRNDLKVLVEKGLPKALERLSGLTMLMDWRQGQACENKIQELCEIVQIFMKMYRAELIAKEAVLDALATSDSRDLLTAMSASWIHQPFIDRTVLSRLFALVK